MKSSFKKHLLELASDLPVGIATKLVVVSEVDSTNSLAKTLAQQGAQEGTVVIAETQKRGRGRFERQWESPKGGLYLSIVLRPTTPVEKTSVLPLITALAVSQTMSTFHLTAMIKWPNDVLVNKKKIAGILLESELEGSQISYIVVGIGINLNIDLNQISLELRNRTTSLKQETHSTADIQKFLKIFFQQFQKYYELFSREQYDQLLLEWKHHSDTLGKAVKVVTSQETFEGVAIDIDSSGFLIVKKQNGSLKKIMSGDCLYLNET